MSGIKAASTTASVPQEGHNAVGSPATAKKAPLVHDSGSQKAKHRTHHEQVPGTETSDKL